MNNIIARLAASLALTIPSVTLAEDYKTVPHVEAVANNQGAINVEIKKLPETGLYGTGIPVIKGDQKFQVGGNPQPEQQPAPVARQPHGVCPSLLPMDGHFNPNNIDLRARRLRLYTPELELDRQIDDFYFTSVQNIRTREIVSWIVIVRDEAGCEYQMEQADQTAAIRLTETLYSAVWNDKISMSIELIHCSNNTQICNAQLRLGSYRLP